MVCSFCKVSIWLRRLPMQQSPLSIQISVALIVSTSAGCLYYYAAASRAAALFLTSTFARWNGGSPASTAAKTSACTCRTSGSNPKKTDRPPSGLYPGNSLGQGRGHCQLPLPQGRPIVPTGGCTLMVTPDPNSNPYPGPITSASGRPTVSTGGCTLMVTLRKGKPSGSTCAMSTTGQDAHREHRGCQKGVEGVKRARATHADGRRWCWCWWWCWWGW